MLLSWLVFSSSIRSCPCHLMIKKKICKQWVLQTTVKRQRTYHAWGSANPGYMWSVLCNLLWNICMFITVHHTLVGKWFLRDCRVYFRVYFLSKMCSLLPCLFNDITFSRYARPDVSLMRIYTWMHVPINVTFPATDACFTKQKLAAPSFCNVWQVPLHMVRWGHFSLVVQLH